MQVNTFERTYAVQNTSNLANDDQKIALENSHNILLPESAFNLLLANGCDFPYVFNISNYNDNTQITHVGVQEFSSNENIAIIPNILMKRLSYPNTIRVKYTQLPTAQSIELQPHHSSFLQHKNNKQYIRNILCNLTCLSIDDTINVIIENKSYALNCTNVKPSIFNGVSISDNQYNININLIDPIVNDEEGITCPIESNVNNTKGNELIDNEYNTMDGTTNAAGDDDTGGFSDSASGGWGSSADIGSEYEYYYDGQDEIPIKDKSYEFTPPPEMGNDIQYVPDSNSTADGNSRPIKPVNIKNDYRAWICEFCHSINNLLDSIKRDYKCVQCVGKYKPGQTIIESKEEDKPIPRKPQFTVWICTCSAFNAIEWNQCDICTSKKPDEGLVTILTDEQPAPRIKQQEINNYQPEPAPQKATSWICNKCYTINKNNNLLCLGCGRGKYGGDGDDNGNNNHENKVKHRFEYYGKLPIAGKTKKMSLYPIVSHKQAMNKRLIEVFGYGYRNSLLFDDNYGTNNVRNKWINKKISHGFMDIVDVSSEDLPKGSKSMAINERNGYIAMIRNGYIIVLQPIGCNKFNILAHYSLGSDFKHSTEGVTRIRFVNNDIYVFDSISYVIYNYILDPIKGIIALKQELFDKYFIEAEVNDFVISDQLLIVLFGRWLGVYKLKPTFEWYHAVAYSQSESTRASSIEMSVFDDWENNNQEKDNEKEEEEEEKRSVENKIYPIKMDYNPSIKHYIFINCEHNIIAIHATNPTFDFLHIGSNTKNGVSFCNSRQYGTFWINNEKDMIIQSPVWDHLHTTVIMSLEKQFKFENFQMMPFNNKINGKQFDVKNISKLNNIAYDEGYGISGRLLINCTVKINELERPMFYELFNQNELLPLKEYLENNDYFLMPGTDFKPFNLIVYVFEMLYGSDLINSLVQSPDFNSVYALPGIDKNNNQEEKEEKKEEEKKEHMNDNINKLLIIGSKCLIYVNDRWCDGIVTKIYFDENDKECLEIEYVAHYDLEITKKVIFNRYNKLLKYNESIPLKDMNDIQSIKWKIGEKCLYFDEAFNEWISADIINIITDDNGEKSINISMEYESKTVKYNDINLHKLDDVVVDNQLNNENENENDEMDDGEDMDLEQDEGDKNKVAMMKIGAEGPMDQSYIAIKAIGKEKAEIDEDLVFVNEDDMEIEPEGVNELENN